LHKVDGILPQLPLIMRQIIQTTVKRTLRTPSETREIK